MRKADEFCCNWRIKAPIFSVVLLDEKLEFVAFGYEAEDVYGDKATDQEHEHLRLFQNFTLPLCNPDIVSVLD